jgi:hypothetical protein
MLKQAFLYKFVQISIFAAVWLLVSFWLHSS